MMKVLLLGMPDVASAFDRTMRIPNLGIASIAANLDGAEVHVLDLVLHPKAVGRVVKEHLERLRPDVVGLSAMTFQYDTACKVAEIAKTILPSTVTVLGGYHATLAYNLIELDPQAESIDFLIRGEGEKPMNDLLRVLRTNGSLSDVPGLSYRSGDKMVHNPRTELQDLTSIRIPDRRARISNRFSYFGKPFDAVETSRGCLKACRFCSIQQMYGQSYRCYSTERIIADIADARANGARGIFFVDDNINLNPGRLLDICRTIVDAGMDDMEYICQADVAGFLNEPELPAVMKRAGFSGVFLGIESVSPDNWVFLKKRNSYDGTRKVVQALRDHKIATAGGFILGNPGDDAAAIRSAFSTAVDLPLDHAIMWCLTPYPGTKVREEMLADGLVENPYDFSRYNGFICNIRTRKMSYRKLVRRIAIEGSKLYFNPRFLLRSRAWRLNLGSMLMFLGSSLEYITRAPRNRLYSSRHKM